MGIYSFSQYIHISITFFQKIFQGQFINLKVVYKEMVLHFATSFLCKLWIYSANALRIYNCIARCSLLTSKSLFFQELPLKIERTKSERIIPRIRFRSCNCGHNIRAWPSHLSVALYDHQGCINNCCMSGVE